MTNVIEAVWVDGGMVCQYLGSIRPVETGAYPLQPPKDTSTPTDLNSSKGCIDE
jgi:hypothetical protein